MSLLQGNSKHLHNKLLQLLPFILSYDLQI